MFTDIVTSTDLVGVIGDDDWSELLGWHDRELRAAFAEHRGEVVNTTGDGFFVAFDRTQEAIECAIDIQRRLVRHRRDHGFAPSVRIGLHRAEATRRGRDYAGRSVNIAARVGAAAGRDEILVTFEALQDLDAANIALSEPRELSLKGVREPVGVRAVNWR
jgi:class 3 adenylate cyclase